MQSEKITHGSKKEGNKEQTESKSDLHFFLQMNFY